MLVDTSSPRFILAFQPPPLFCIQRATPLYRSVFAFESCTRCRWNSIEFARFDRGKIFDNSRRWKLKTFEFDFDGNDLVGIGYLLEMGVDGGRSFSCFFASCGKKLGDKEIRVERLIYILIRNLSRKFPRARWTTTIAYPSFRSLARDKAGAFIRVPPVSSALSYSYLITSD